MEDQWKVRSLESNFKPTQDTCIITIIVTILYIIRNAIVKNYLLRLTAKMNVKPEQKEKLFGSLYRGLVYTTLSCYGIFCLSQESYIFNFFEYTLTWKDNLIPKRVIFYYYLEIGHYISSIVYIFLEPKMSDFYQMLLHHFVTLVLLFVSYHVNLLRYGMVIMFLHDVSDPFMEIAKILVYSKRQRFADYMFLVFAFVFITTRCFIFPTCLVFPCYYYGFKYGLNRLFKALLCSLTTLYALNVIWSFFILKMIHSYAKHGCIKGDIRTDKIEPKAKRL